MKLRNTTDFDPGVLRALLRVVVRDVECVMTDFHPLGWSKDAVRARAERILSECDVWIRQRRAADTRDYRGEAERALDAGHADRAGRLVVLAEHGASSGHATYSGRRLRLTLAGASTVDFLWLARHEVWHLFGVGHGYFPDAIMHATPGAMEAVRHQYRPQITRWGASLPAKRPTVPAPKASAEDRAAAKLAAISAREKAWTTKLRRAQTALSKLKDSRRYYERQIAKAASRGTP